jgi:hypothetical protein
MARKMGRGRMSAHNKVYFDKHGLLGKVVSELPLLHRE